MAIYPQVSQATLICAMYQQYLWCAWRMRIRTQEAVLLYLDPDLKICPNLEPRLQYVILKTVKNTSRFVLKNYSLKKIFRQTKQKNGMWRKLWIKTVNVCQWVVFFQFLAVRTRIQIFKVEGRRGFKGIPVLLEMVINYINKEVYFFRDPL